MKNENPVPRSFNAGTHGVDVQAACTAKKLNFAKLMMGTVLHAQNEGTAKMNVNDQRSFARRHLTEQVNVVRRLAGKAETAVFEGAVLKSGCPVTVAGWPEDGEPNVMSPFCVCLLFLFLTNAISWTN